MTGRCLSFRALATLLFTCTNLVLALHAERSLAYSALACFRMGMSGSASFHNVRKSL
jgi:hypothetical protein